GSALLLGDRPQLFQRGISAILANSPSYLYTPNSPFFGATPNIGSSTPLILKTGTPLNSTITSVSAGAANGDNINAGLAANAGRFNTSLGAGAGTNGLQSSFGTVPRTKSLFGT